ncbi:MAG TPA: hypothetical protein VF476_07965 [Chitinophagaceae bacterium]
MKTILSERNLVVLLFVMVLVTFSLAHEDTKKMEFLNNAANVSATAAGKIQSPQIRDISTPTSLTVIPVK